MHSSANVLFDTSFWDSSPPRLQTKVLSTISSRLLHHDLDGRLLISLMAAIQASTLEEIRSEACRIFQVIISRRNSGVSFPRQWLESLKTNQRDSLLKFQGSTLAKHQSSIISKYPSYPFEVQDLDVFYASYMKRPSTFKIERGHKILTLGSCFAINVARHLSSKGYSAESFELGELVNNTFTNLFILKNEVESHSDWVSLQPSMADSVRKFKAGLGSANFVILTLGLGLAFFRDEDGAPLRDPLYSFRKEHYRGYTMKPIPTDVNLSNLRKIISCIHHINPKAKIIVTLSPVPLDGCKGSFASAIEADCISKSIGRVTLALAESEGLDFTYFPSFELVRWVATARQSPPSFGGDIDDCYLRHPTTEVIESVMECFIDQYCNA